MQREVISLYRNLLKAARPFKPKTTYNVKEAFKLRKNIQNPDHIKNFIEQGKKTHSVLVRLHTLPPDVFEEIFLKVPSNSTNVPNFYLRFLGVDSDEQEQMQ